MAHFSTWSLIVAADPMVKLIMLILLMASVCSWAIIFQRISLLKEARHHLNVFLKQFDEGVDLNKLYRHFSKTRNYGIVSVFSSGFGEYMRLKGKLQVPINTILDNIERTMRIQTSEVTAQLQSQLSLLGTIGAVAPYVGLLGTVWGIMSSFSVLGGMQQVTLAVVAPHISEALIATALGLFVAIPAVVAYNRFTMRIERMLEQYENFQDHFSGMLEKELYFSVDRAQIGQKGFK